MLDATADSAWNDMSGKYLDADKVEQARAAKNGLLHEDERVYESAHLRMHRQDRKETRWNTVGG